MLWHEDAVAQEWTIAIRGGPDRLLLARVLQKMSVPALELLAVRYDAGRGNEPPRIEVRCRAGEPRVRLVARRLATLHATRQVDVFHA